MTKISKFLLFIFCLFCLFCYIGSVKADTCVKTDYWNYLSNQWNNQDTLTIGHNTITKNFVNNSTTSFGNVSYIKGQLWYIITNTSNNSYYSNIDLQQTCSHYTWSSQTGQAMTITYQDGSTAQVNASSFGFPICDTYNSSGQVYQVLQYEPNITSINIALIDTNDNVVMCEVGVNGNFNCPVNSNTSYKAFRYEFNLEKGNATIKYSLASSTLDRCNTDTQEIINNNNSNTTSINNNITNLNDNILNSSINSQTTSDVGNISSNNINTDSKNVVLDFMLMPITFLNNILNSFNNTCATLCLGNCGSGHYNDWRFVFPCVDIKSFIGDTIYNTIDVLMCFGMIFAFLRSVVNFLKKALMLESDVSSEVRIF